MGPSIKRKTWASGLAVALLLVLTTACGSDGGDGSPSLTLPNVSVPEVSVPEVSVPEVSVPEVSVPEVSIPDLTTTTRPSTTTTAEPTTTTTERRDTTTTEEPSTTTTEEETTTTTKASTTTTEDDDEVAAGTTTTTVAGTTDDEGTSPWLWLLLLALLAAIGAVIWLLLRNKKKAAAAKWAASGRDLARKAAATAASLERSASTLEGPAAGDRQAWLTDAQHLGIIESSAAALLPDAPPVPGDTAGTNSATAALEKLRSDAAACRSAVTDAERTRFELVGPTDEQLRFAAETVRRSSSALAASATALSTAVDRIAPPPAPTA